MDCVRTAVALAIGTCCALACNAESVASTSKVSASASEVKVEMVAQAKPSTASPGDAGNKLRDRIRYLELATLCHAEHLNLFVQFRRREMSIVYDGKDESRLWGAVHITGDVAEGGVQFHSGEASLRNWSNFGTNPFRGFCRTARDSAKDVFVTFAVKADPLKGKSFWSVGVVDRGVFTHAKLPGNLTQKEADKKAYDMLTKEVGHRLFGVGAGRAPGYPPSSRISKALDDLVRRRTW